MEVINTINKEILGYKISVETMNGIDVKEMSKKGVKAYKFITNILEGQYVFDTIDELRIETNKLI